MRTTRDRLRHSLLFELLAVLIVTPLGNLVFGVPMHDFGVLAIIATAIAVCWNYGYNLAFDHAMNRRFGSTAKTLPVRIIHAFLFEAGLLFALVPVIAWHLDVSLWQALVIDLSLSAFYLVYAFIFNWLYDVAFPIPLPDRSAPETSSDASSGNSPGNPLVSRHLQRRNPRQ